MSEKIYPVSFDEDAHEKLVGLLKNIKGRFILSYNDHPEIWRLYKCFISGR